MNEKLNILPDFSSVVVAGIRVVVVVAIVVVVVVVGMPKSKMFKKSRFGTPAVVSSVVVVANSAFVVSSNSSDVIFCFMFCKAWLRSSKVFKILNKSLFVSDLLFVVVSSMTAGFFVILSNSVEVVTFVLIIVLLKLPTLSNRLSTSFKAIRLSEVFGSVSNTC